MADKKYEALKAKVEKLGSLSNEVSFMISDEEQDVLKLKSEAIGIKISDLIREYVVDTSLFDKSPFEEKKPKRTAQRKDS